MTPIPFKEQNIVYAENQPEYTPLPAKVCDDRLGSVVSCWKLSFRERITLLFTGKVWMQLLMFRNAQGLVNPLTPSYLTTKKDEVIS